MARWHRPEVEKSWLRPVNENAQKGEKEKKGGEGGRQPY